MNKLIFKTFSNIFKKVDKLKKVIALQELKNSLSACGQGFHIYGSFNIGGGRNIVVGDNVHINCDAFIRGGGGLKIGDNVHIGPRATIYTENHDYQGAAIPYDENMISRPVTIGDNVWIGACVMIVPGVTIGEGAIVGAGTVVSKDIPPMAIVAGQSWRSIGTRDEEHYKQLKEKKYFGGVSGKLFIREESRK